MTLAHNRATICLDISPAERQKGKKFTINFGVIRLAFTGIGKFHGIRLTLPDEDSLIG